jgi:hypothetical protein
MKNQEESSSLYPCSLNRYITVFDALPQDMKSID